MRLIDADKLFPYGAVPYVENDGFETADKIYGIIKNAPTVAAVPVVRCKDCKHWHEEAGWCNQHSSFIDDRGVFCKPWESNDWKMFDENDFCSYGERKDDGNN